MYQFFVQPQVNRTDKSLFGYEVLLRKECNGNWAVPSDFTEISVEEQTVLVENTANILHAATEQNTLSFNLNQEQLQDPATLGAIIALKKRIGSAHLLIELTEAPTLQEMQELSCVFRQHDIALALDDVGTGSNTFENIQCLLPFVDEIKVAMQNFRADGDCDKICQYLTFWTAQAEKFRLRMVLEGVEDDRDIETAHRHGIDILQGYYFGRPALPQESVA